MGVDCQPARKAMRIHWPLSDKEENNASHNGTKSIQIFFLYFIQMHFLFSPSIHLKSSRKTPNLTWNIGTTTISNGKRRPKREKRDSRGREREKILALFQGPSFSYIQILSFRVGYCRMGMKRSDQHPINRQSIFRKRDSTQNKWIKEEKTVQQSSGWMM